MKGKLSYNKWYVSSMDTNSYIGERTINGKYQQVGVNSHCLACAKTDILAKYGGRVDTRGWQKQGTCGLFLLAMSKGNIEHENRKSHY